MQKKRMTTPKVWASFRPQKRQEVQIPVIFAVKSWEDQILGARRRSHRKRIKITRNFENKAFSLVFFCFSGTGHLPLAGFPQRSMRQRRTSAAKCDHPPHATEAIDPAPPFTRRQFPAVPPWPGQGLVEERSGFSKPREKSCRGPMRAR